MTAPTLYQHYKTLARMTVFQAAPEAISEQAAATRAAARQLLTNQAQLNKRLWRIECRLSARAIRIARRELAASNG